MLLYINQNLHTHIDEKNQISKSKWYYSVQFSRLVVPDSVTPWTVACQASLSITSSQNLLKLMSSEPVMQSIISSSIVPFSSCLPSFPASGSFQMSQFFASCGQSIGGSDSASVLPMNIPDQFPLGLTALISLQSNGLSSLLQHHSSKASILQHSAFFIVQLSHPYSSLKFHNFVHFYLALNKQF